jgi:glycine/D-amino acid oxidase-like deaminating enzyme
MKQLKNGQLVIGGGWPARPARESGAPGIVLDSLIGNISLAQHVVPGIADLHVIRSWAGTNTMLDLVSVLGEVEAIPGLYIAVPGDAGYTLGPYCARLVVDQMLGRAPDYPLSPFSVMRFA